MTTEKYLMVLTKIYLLSMLQNVQEEIKDVKNLVIELKTETTKLKKKIDDVEDINEKLIKRVINVEKEHWQNAQYGRCKNVELSGIPDSVEDNELEVKIIEVLERVGLKINSNDIEACHRLYQSKSEAKKGVPKRVIVRGL